MPHFSAILFLCTGFLLLPFSSSAVSLFSTENIPKAADSIAKQMDDQLMHRFVTSPAAPGKKDAARRGLMIMGTVPVDLNNLNVSCPAARQMSEEIARWFLSRGYRYQELRKGKNIRFDPKTGEILLTRDLTRLAKLTASSQVVLAGTYLISPIQIRFSMRLIHTPTNEVLAMGTETVEITDDLRPLLSDQKNNTKSAKTPSVSTVLP